jgi:Flp pilus assembly pilin Flp
VFGLGLAEGAGPGVPPAVRRVHVEGRLRNLDNCYFQGETAVKNLIARFVREDEGQDLVEYAFLVGLIALVAFVGVQTLGQKINDYYGTTINNSAPFGS